MWARQLCCFSINTFQKPLISVHEANPLRMTSPTSSRAEPASEQLPSDRHVRCPGGCFNRNHQHQVNTNWQKVCLTGSRGRCGFRTVQHCWGHTVTGGRWRGRSSRPWWTPPETAYLRKNKTRRQIPLKVFLNNDFSARSVNPVFLSELTGGSVEWTWSSEPLEKTNLACLPVTFPMLILNRWNKGQNTSLLAGQHPLPPFSSFCCRISSSSVFRFSKNTFRCVFASSEPLLTDLSLSSEL